MFTGLETLDGPDAGQAGLDPADEVPTGPDDDPAEFKGSAGAAITPGAGDTGTGGPMITGLALLTVTGPDGGAITVETGVLETHELQAGLAAP